MEESLKKWKTNIKKKDLFSIENIKDNPISIILIKKHTVKDHLNSEEMLESLHSFVNTKDFNQKLKYIFNFYDTNGDGEISSIELFEILKVLNKGILEDWKIQNIVDKTFAEVGEYRLSMNFEEFKAMILKRNKKLLEIMGCDK